jgi:hypothetical protein
VVIIIKPINKFKIYKFDAAPFFFFIDVFPPEFTNKNKPNLVYLIDTLRNNPIMPLPMRVDRVFNGERSILIRPKDPITFPVTDDLTASINPTPFLKLGFEKLLSFTEARSQEKFMLSLSIDHASKWWEITRYLHGVLPTLEEDFSAFLRAYLHTMLRAKLLEEDITEAALNYCKLIADICEKRLDQNNITIEINGKQEKVKMYKVKELKYYKKFKKTRETQYHPELIDIEIYDFSKIGFNAKDERDTVLNELHAKEIKYIPLLFYDDLLECMLQNAKTLEENSKEILDPSLLLEKNVIITENPEVSDKDRKQTYSWWNSFDNIEISPIIDSITSAYKDFWNADKSWDERI